MISLGNQRDEQLFISWTLSGSAHRASPISGVHCYCTYTVFAFALKAETAENTKNETVFVAVTEVITLFFFLLAILLSSPLLAPVERAQSIASSRERVSREA